MPVPPRGGSRLRRFVWYWLPVLLWMAFIFGMSTNAGAPRNTSRFIAPIVRWLYPSISDAALRNVIFTVRKSAHVTEYAVLAVLLWRARRQASWSERRPWCRNEAFFALTVAALFAATDEWHQSFVPSREGRPLDVLIDTVGATAGLLVCWRTGAWLKRW